MRAAQTETPKVVSDAGWRLKMIDFDEELKKFHPSLEMEDVQDAIYNQDVTDLADVLVRMVKDAKEEGQGEI